jgi:hypothetical protein
MEFQLIVRDFCLAMGRELPHVICDEPHIVSNPRDSNERALRMGLESTAHCFKLAADHGSAVAENTDGFSLPNGHGQYSYGADPSGAVASSPRS